MSVTLTWNISTIDCPTKHFYVYKNVWSWSPRNPQNLSPHASPWICWFCLSEPELDSEDLSRYNVEKVWFVDSWTTVFSTSKTSICSPRKRTWLAGKSSFSMGNTSSIGGCSIVMLVVQKLFENGKTLQTFGPIDCWFFCAWQDFSITSSLTSGSHISIRASFTKRSCCTSIIGDSIRDRNGQSFEGWFFREPFCLAF